MDTFSKKKQDYQLKLEGLNEVKQRLDKSRKKIAEERKKKKELLESFQKKAELLRKFKEELSHASKDLEGFIGTQRKIKRKGSELFSKQKKRLQWPVKGKVIYAFGKTLDRASGLRLSRKGVVIKTDKPQPVKSVFAGQVVFADWFKGYGKLVIISHGEGYITVYANLKTIKIKDKSSVKKGDIIGVSGTSGPLIEQSVYFELRKDGKAISPISWLKK